MYYPLFSIQFYLTIFINFQQVSKYNKICLLFIENNNNKKKNNHTNPIEVKKNLFK